MIAKAEISMNRHVTKESTRAVKDALEGVKDLSLEARLIERRERFLRSLKFPGMNERANQLSEAESGTFRWIFDLEDNSDDHIEVEAEFLPPQAAFGEKPWDHYSDWLRSESDIYWINGKPGSGKSTLMKYLVGSSHTLDHLKQWRSEAIILSHYFWKPGLGMRSNLKGLYCNLLHQLFSHRLSQLDGVIVRHATLTDKEDVTDWSLHDLKALFNDTLEARIPPLSIFIDGLDEIMSEDRIPLIETIESFRMLHVGKMCLSSRPEQQFRVRFNKYQQLRVQDLTYKDIYQFSIAQLKKHNIEARYLSRLVRQLIRKAEGVFLWIILAIRSICTGLDTEDTLEELQTRLSVLPNELSDLYIEMWARLNESKVVYQETAARYFNLVIKHEYLVAKMSRKLPNSWVNHDFSVLQLMAATHPLTSKYSQNHEELGAFCETVKNAVQIRCAGLLDIEFIGGSNERPEMTRYLESRVSFVHRTAYDFLTATSQGLEILNIDPLSQDQHFLLLIKGLLFISKTVHKQDSHEILAQLSIIKDGSLSAEVEQLFWLCKSTYEEGNLYYRFTYPNPLPHFFSIAAFPTFYRLILKSISELDDASAVATLVLEQIFSPFICQHDPSPEFVVALLDAGANPHAETILLQEHPEVKFGTITAGFESHLSRAVEILYIELYFPPSHRNVFTICTILLKTKPDLNRRVPLLLNISKQRGLIEVGGVDRIVSRYGDLSTAQSEGESEVCVILDVNLAFMFALLFKRLEEHSKGKLGMVQPYFDLRITEPSAKIVVIHSILYQSTFNIPMVNFYRPTSDETSDIMLEHLRLTGVLNYSKATKIFQVWEELIVTKLQDEKLEQLLLHPLQELANRRCGICYL